MKSLFSLSAITAAACLTGCASTHTPPPGLVTARAVVRAAEADAQVLRHAPLELKRATVSLRRADELDARRESLGDVESAAYVASRQAEVALAIARAKTSEDAIKSAEVERERARADARTEQALRAAGQAATARAEASAAKVEASTAQRQADAARSEASAAQARAAMARQQADAARATASGAQLQAQALQQQLEDLKARPTERGMLVTLGDLLFEFGRAEIKPGAWDAMHKLAAYLKEHADRWVLVEGFTDSVGGDSANLALSQRRADAVAVALQSLGVQGDRIRTRGYGESFPVADNSSDTNRALNRRVEGYISDNQQPVRARG